MATWRAGPGMKIQRRKWSSALDSIVAFLAVAPGSSALFRPMLYVGAECLLCSIAGGWDPRTVPEIELVIYGDGDQFWGIASPWPVEMRPRLKLGAA